MKRTFALLFLFSAFTGNAQDFVKDTTQRITIDSSSIMVPVTLKSEDHFLIIDCLEGVSRTEWADYANQVAKGMDTAYNPAKPITVTLSSSVIAELYFEISAQQERISAVLNRDLRTNLLPQLKSYSWLYRQLLNIQTQNSVLMEQRKLRTFTLLRKIK